EFGNIWEKSIRLSFIPIPFAAIMYSSSLMLNTLERINLPKFGTLIIAIAIKAFRKDGPKTATIDIASRIDGNASMISKNLEMMVSTQRPYYPATIPRRLPAMIDPITEENPTHREILAPWIILDSISRPKSSVPSQYSEEGGCRRSDMTCSLIPSFVKKEANIASKI